MREELIEARDKVQRQLEILSAGPVGKGGSLDAEQAIPMLQNVLADIEDRLADLEKDDA